MLPRVLICIIEEATCMHSFIFPLKFETQAQKKKIKVVNQLLHNKIADKGIHFVKDKHLTDGTGSNVLTKHVEITRHLIAHS